MASPRTSLLTGVKSKSASGAKLPKGVKKARKSAALIIAEKDIAELKTDMVEVKRLLWGILGGIGTTILSVAGTGISFYIFR